jgi:Glyoxalase-like domain
MSRMWMDHVIYAVDDLDAAGAVLFDREGLASVPGGRHEGWGTANRIVPLGATYLELITVADRARAADSLLGRWVASRASHLCRPLGWAVRTGELDQVAGRLGLTVSSGARAAPTGEVLRWRSAGMEQAAAESLLPFFIEWAEGVRLPGTTTVNHPAAPAAISKVLLQGDPGRLAAWLGGHALPIVVHPGGPAVAAVVISAASGEIVIGTEQRS